MLPALGETLFFHLVTTFGKKEQSEKKEEKEDRDEGKETDLQVTER